MGAGPVEGRLEGLGSRKESGRARGPNLGKGPLWVWKPMGRNLRIGGHMAYHNGVRACSDGATTHTKCRRSWASLLVVRRS